MKTNQLLLAASLAACVSLSARAVTTTTVPAGVTVTVPPQAAAVGFTNNVLDDEFTTQTVTSSTSTTSGYNWYPYEWGLATPSDITLNTGAGSGATAGATGVLTMSGGGNVCSVNTYPSAGGAIPGSWQHGYFEARIQFSQTNPQQGGWPSFWSFGTSAFSHLTGSAWTSQQTSENDFFEAFPYNATFAGSNTLHNWQHASNAVAGTDTGNTNSENYMQSLVGTTQSAQPNDGKWHTIGCLWVATSSTTGYVEYYLDNYLIAHEGGVTRFQVGAGTPLVNQETEHMFLILGSGTGWPLNIDWVRIWQGTGTGSNNGGSGTTAQTVSNFPATLNLSTTQSPYTLPATTSAGLTLTYSVASGPATVSGNTLKLTGAGTVVVNATQAGNATYAAYAGSETITVTSPGTQALSGFPSTLSLVTTQSPYSLPATTSAGLTVTYTVVSGPATISGHTLTLTGSGTVVVNASQAGNSSYAAYAGTETITVSAASQSLSNFPSTLTLSIGQSPYTLPSTSTAGLPVTYSVTSGPASVSGTKLTLNGAGTVVLHATNPGNALYASFALNETITVTALQQQTVSNFPSTLSLTMAQTPYTLPSTTSAGLTLSYSVVSGPAKVSGNTLTLTGAGTVVLNATQAGNSTYATYSGAEAITVTTVGQTITGFPSTLSLSTSQSPYTLPATTSAGLTVSYSVTSGPGAVSGNKLTLSGAGTVVVKATQAGNATYAAYSGSETITVTSASLGTQTVSNFPATQNYSLGTGPISLPSTTSAGLPITYTVVSGPATVSGNTLTITGTGTVVISASQGGNSSYGAYTGTETITVTSASTLTFSQWESNYFTSSQISNTAISGATATPENDGVPNLLKYFYDINPAVPMSATDFAAMSTSDVDTTTTPGTTYLTLTYRENAKATGVTAHVQTSTDLQTWTTVTPDISHQTGTDPNTGDPIYEVEVNTNGATSEFIRLNVTSP